jgi:hypothetical protein
MIERKKVLKHVKEAMERIEKMDNVEIWIYVCQGSLEEKQNIQQTRTYRFMPLLDRVVARCVVREADGIVSNLD